MKKLTDGEQLNKGHAGRNSAIGFLMGMLLGGLVDSFTGDYGFATVAGMILGVLIGYRSAGRFHLMEYSPRVVRYLVISGILFFASLLAFFYLIGEQSRSEFSVMVALVPVLFGAFFTAALGYAISTLDELQRRIQVEAIAIGFGITGLIVLAIGLLGLVGMSQPDWLMVIPIMIGAWLVGKLWTRWRYR